MLKTFYKISTQYYSEKKCWILKNREMYHVHELDASYLKMLIPSKVIYRFTIIWSRSQQIVYVCVDIENTFLKNILKY